MTTLDKWIRQDNKEKHNKPKEKHKTPGEELRELIDEVGMDTVKEAINDLKLYKLPTGAVSVYFKEGEGFVIRYDSRTYENRLDDLITNLTVLSKIWNRLIQLNPSPRYLSKAYDDDIYAIVIDVINDREGEDRIEIEGFKVAVSKHRIGARILDLARNEPEIPADAIEEEKGIL
ncbi:hypothetical protein DRN87_02115 [Candidatus Geothermarchaeota archaeon]|nr:MAG: hypothetical protein DRN87_02115 [Candidatus Geothermarchaeota archaeon]